MAGKFVPIDFPALEAALLERASTLVPQWLPGGKRVGAEWVCAGLEGGAGGSCSVNLNTGAWGEFEQDLKGKNLLDLYAASRGLGRVEAAKELMGQLGWAPATASTPARPPPAEPPKVQTSEREQWTTLRPVPPAAPKATFKHYARLESDIEHVAEYRVGDELHGYVVRFRTSDGGKDPLPRTWCLGSRDGAYSWKWRQWDEPRPLYLPGHAPPGGRTVVVVEGEKKADALQALLDSAFPGVYCVVGWPGGSKAWQKADWSWLAGCTVLLWPDCDAKREPLSAAEKKATPDKLAQQVLAEKKPLRPPAQQPGMQAMLGIGEQLRDRHGCGVSLLPIPAPGAVADGWDCADAIAEGWDAERVVHFFAGAYGLPAGVVVKVVKGGGDGPPETPREPSANAGSGEDPFQDHLDYICDVQDCEPWELAVNRKLLIAALHKAPAIASCLGFNELTNAPCTTQAWPWRDRPGLLADNDDLRFGDWLSSEYKLKPASRAALAEAIDTVADSRRFHPIRDWLKGLKHDGRSRLGKWLMHVCRMDAAKVSPRRQEYLALMGRYMLMGLVARVMKPGCKFDYSPVFEGRTGMGKSTLVKVLVGEEYFSDTHFDIGTGKDGMEQLEGLWAYELSELTAFKRADSEQIKQFFSSTVDRFRGAYGKFVQPHPRQCVIFCSTNKRQYLYDLTGNRRFWPIWIDVRVRLEWLVKWREQLFAEAYALWAAGERYWPTEEEEDTYFLPEQRQRLVETTVQSRLYELLTREGAAATEGRTTRYLSMDTDFVTLPQLTEALGADPAKSTSLLEGQIRAWLDAHDWMSSRETTGSRRRGFRRPDVWPPKGDDDSDEAAAAAASAEVDESEAGPARAEATHGGSDDEPF